MTIQEVKASVYKNGLISIIRGGFSVTEIVQLSEALLAGGVTLVEVTLNSSHALEGIAQVQKELGSQMLVGAGTVRSKEDVMKAINAGAKYLIAPNLDLDAVQEALKQDVLIVPGIFTATEAQNAFLAGCQTVKLFPADALGPSYLKALRAPLDHIDFVPSGGVNHTSIADFHKAGAVAYGAGSALVKNVAIDKVELNALTQRSTVLVKALEAARNA